MKHRFLGLLFIMFSASFAQNNAKEVLFSIDNKPFYTDEFIRIYNKNLDLVKDESQKDLNQYLELFIGYKLKVTKALKLGLENGEQYKNELKTYRSQLAKNYTTDSKVTKELVQEGYQRTLKEVNASHILIKCDEFAQPADTLVAYQKAISIRNKALAGEDFGTLAQANSDDPSAKDNKGNLGFFTGFRMVYAFESAAYKTALGQISMPVRTRFGYHIIKVNEIRDNPGEISVAHIMIMNAKEGEDKNKAKTTIDEIYKKLQQGEKFDSLANQFSEDKSSSGKGGVLNRFGSGQLSSDEFETAAFALSKENPLSKPFQTQYGWHIVKLIEKYPVKSLAESKTELETKISKDERSRLIVNSLNDKLRKKYPVKINSKLLAQANSQINETYYDAKWELPKDLKPFETALFSIEKTPVSAKSYLEYVNGQQKSGTKIKPLAKLSDVLLKDFTDEQLGKYYDSNLEKEFPEFSSIIDEYRDGLLLFDLMEKEIWQRSKTDTLGLKSFYAGEKNKPSWKTRANAIVLSSTKMETIKQALELLKKNSPTKDIKEKLNTKETINVMATEGVFEQDAAALPKNTKMEVGISEIVKQGDYYFVTKIDKIIPSTTKTFEESKGKVINDYQTFLEQNWVSELKKEFTITTNKEVFEKVKIQIKK